MAMLFPANPNTIEAAYKKVMMNLLVGVNGSTRPFPNGVKKPITVKPKGKTSSLKLHAVETYGSLKNHE